MDGTVRVLSTYIYLEFTKSICLFQLCAKYYLWYFNIIATLLRVDSIFTSQDLISSPIWIIACRRKKWWCLPLLTNHCSCHTSLINNNLIDNCTVRRRVINAHVAAWQSPPGHTAAASQPRYPMSEFTHHPPTSQCRVEGGILQAVDEHVCGAHTVVHSSGETWLWLSGAAAGSSDTHFVCTVLAALPG